MLTGSIEDLSERISTGDSSTESGVTILSQECRSGGRSGHHIRVSHYIMRVEENDEEYNQV